MTQPSKKMMDSSPLGSSQVKFLTEKKETKGQEKIDCCIFTPAMVEKFENTSIKAPVGVILSS